MSIATSTSTMYNERTKMDGQFTAKSAETASIGHYSTVRNQVYSQDADEEKLREEQEQQEQQSQYDKALKAENVAANKMRKALEEGLISEGLLHATRMLSELRTTSLTPKNYYSLYLDIVRKLQYLEDFFEGYLSMKKATITIDKLIEKVQYIGNIVPRLYLLITMGSLAIKLREQPAEKMIIDLVNMCKGVQHPTRGLFLRLYMTHKLKDKLPDKNSVYGNDYTSSVQFLIQNFTDTVNLFCRLKGDWKGEKREKEREQLKTLTGQNLETLSQLESITTDTYNTVVLPEILNTIIKYKDVMSQEYLMLCVVSAFPDDYHLVTLNMFLDATTRLQPKVDLKLILTTLIDRLKHFGQNFPQSIPEDSNIIDSFLTCVSRIHKEVSLKEDALLETINSLIGLSLTVHPNSIVHVNMIVDSIVSTLENIEQTKKDSSIQPILKKILSDTIVGSFDNVLSVLEVNNFAMIMERLSFENRKKVSVELVNSALKQGVVFSDWEQISKFLSLIDPLIKDQPDGSEKYSSPEFEQEQCNVASLLHLCQNDDTDVLFKMYLTIRKFFGSGGEHRLKYTLVPLLYAHLKLADRIAENNLEKRATVEKVFEVCLQTLQALSKFELELSLTLYLSMAIASDKHQQTPYTIEMLTQALLLYDSLENTKKFDYLLVIFNSLRSINNLDTENLSNYISNACSYASKLLLKPQQCRAILLSSFLYFPRPNNTLIEDREKAFACLQGSARIVKECRKPQHLALLIEILNVCLIQYENENDLISTQFINGLIDLIKSNVDEAHSDDFGLPEVDGVEQPLYKVVSHFEQTKDSISRKKSNPLFKDIRF